MNNKPEVSFNKPIVIIVAGPRYAGKSTLSDLIIKHAPFLIFKAPLARPIKELVAAYHGVTVQQLEMDKERYRLDCQQLGTEVVRAWKDDFWVRVNINRHNGRPIIFDDTRYQNEITTPIEMGANVKTVWITASKERRIERCEALYGAGSFNDALSGHSSENSLTGDEDFWNYKIINNADLIEPLESLARNIAFELLEVPS